ncbi:MAG: YggT family protein [Gammaproteobacteria bacterium]|nr:YggT family protein [Gammaproteobacteria bacterium]
MTILQIILTLIQIIFILRFHLEISQANGFMEPVNTIRKLTNPLALPIKSIIPHYTAKKFAAIIAAFLINTITIWFFNKAGLANALLVATLFLISTWIMFLQYGMFMYVIGSWIQIPAFQRINYLLHKIFTPMLRPIQQIIPSLGGIDFSPIAFLLLLSLISNAFGNLLTRL